MTAKSTYTTKELAELLRVEAHTSITRRSAREGWKSLPRSGRGGGNEWLLQSMPEGTRLEIAKAILAREAKEAAAEPRKQPVNSLQSLPVSCQRRAEARALAVQLARRFYASAGLPKTSAFELFAHQFNTGEAVVADWVRAALPRLSRASLFNWERAIANDGLEALSGSKYGKHRRGTGAMDQPYVFGFIVAHIYKFPHAGATQIYRSLEARLTLQQRPERMPSKRRLQDWYKDWREINAELFTAISNPDAWRSKFRIAFGDAAGLVDRLNQEWEMDSTPSDLILADGKRHTIVGCIDVYSRRVKFHVSRTSSSHAVATCLRKAITLWGVPEMVRTDNGQDYVSRYIDRVLLDMNIYHDVCNPFSPQEKPFVERVFRSFLHDTFELLTGFVGHNVSERKAIEARKSFAQRMLQKDEKIELNLSPDELQKFCDQWAENTYAHREHGKLGCSPYEQARQYDGPVRRVESDDALRLLLLPYDTRTVGKKGIKIFNDAYIASELGLHVGREVQVRADDDDYGIIHIYSLDGSEFICEARGVKHAGLTRLELGARLPQVKNLFVRDYLSALVKGGYVAPGAMVSVNLGTSRARMYHLVRDTGVDAPRLRKDGTELPLTGQQNMWTAMKVIGWFTPASLASAASVGGVTVAESAALDYVKHLYEAGYVQFKGDKEKLYRLVDDTGGLAPMVQRTKVVFDPNTGSLRWHEDLEP